MRAIVHDFWATLKKDFIRIESSFEAETSVSTLYLHYLSNLKRGKSAILE